MEGSAFGFELRDPVPDWPHPGVLAMGERAGVAFHPLLRWFATTGNPSPMSVARVPRAIAPERCFAFLRACMGPSEMDQQPGDRTICGGWHRVHHACDATCWSGAGGDAWTVRPDRPRCHAPF